MKKIQPKIFIDTEVSLESGYTLETGYAIGQTIHFNDTGNEYYHSTDGVWKPVGGKGEPGEQGVQGLKGDAFEYSDFTPAQIATLQQPATDAIASIEAVELSVEQAEALRVQAEQDRETNTGTAIQNAQTATTNANTAATNANNAATLANTKAGLADTAATTANNAATNISSTVINNEQVQAETYNVLNARIAALEGLIRNMIFATATIDKVDVVNELNIHGTTNLILKGTAAPSITPDFVGQFYVNTTAGTTYQSKGITNSGDWKQTSN